VTSGSHKQHAHDLTIDEVTTTPIDELRIRLPAWLAAYAYADFADATAARTVAVLDAHSDDDVLTAIAHYRDVAREYHYYPADAVAREISQAFVRGMAIEPRVEGIDNLRAGLAAGPCLLLCNHLSYSDSQFTDLLLSECGADDLARALVYVAGPKVYDNAMRRMAATGLNTLPTAQSSRLGREGLSPREIAMIALRTVAQAAELMAAGQSILLYAEGSRSRSGHLGSFVRAAARYARIDNCRVIPVALAGTNHAFPVHDTAMKPARVSLTVGHAIEVDPGDRQAAITAAWQQIAALLPEAYRPAQDTPPLV
jgi:1-acyl-sn-glycerol-3-phosphate acyltransferase